LSLALINIEESLENRHQLKYGFLYNYTLQNYGPVECDAVWFGRDIQIK